MSRSMFSKAATNQTDGYVLMENLNLHDKLSINDTDNEDFRCRSNALPRKQRVCPIKVGPPLCPRHRIPSAPTRLASLPSLPSSPVTTRYRVGSDKTSPLFSSPSSSLPYSPTDWRDMTNSPLTSPQTDRLNNETYISTDPLDRQQNLNLHYPTLQNTGTIVALDFLHFVVEFP